MVKCINVYTEHRSKNRKGVVYQVHLDNKIVTYYADPSCGKKCFVYLMELYISKLSDKAKEKDLFYCKPKQKFNKEESTWFYDVPLGHNTLSCKLSGMLLLQDWTKMVNTITVSEPQELAVYTTAGFQKSLLWSNPNIWVHLVFVHMNVQVNNSDSTFLNSSLNLFNHCKKAQISNCMLLELSQTVIHRIKLFPRWSD